MVNHHLLHSKYLNHRDSRVTTKTGLVESSLGWPKSWRRLHHTASQCNSGISVCFWLTMHGTLTLRVGSSRTQHNSLQWRGELPGSSPGFLWVQPEQEPGWKLLWSLWTPASAANTNTDTRRKSNIKEEVTEKTDVLNKTTGVISRSFRQTQLKRNFPDWFCSTPRASPSEVKL